MKRDGLILMAIVFMTLPVSSQTVTLPDTEFLHALIEEGVDTNEDGQITYAEAEGVISLDISGDNEAWGNISDLKGIEHFTNLETLICSFNRLKSLDVSNNTALILLKCHGNKLTSLNVSSNTALEKLNCGVLDRGLLGWGKGNCYGNQLRSLDVSNNTALEDLTCDCNQLTSLDVSHNTALEDLNCGDNQLTILDVSHNTALEWLGCGENLLTSLDVSNNTALASLDCEDNQLTSLDVSGCTALEWLECGENLLTSLDISTNTALKLLACGNNKLSNLDISKNINLFSEMGLFDGRLDLSKMRTLYKVCVWEMPFPPDRANLNTKRSPNVYFTTECSK